MIPKELDIRTMNKVIVDGRGDAYTEAFQVDENGFYPVYFLHGDREQPEMIHHGKIKFYQQADQKENLKEMHKIAISNGFGPGIKYGYTPSIIPVNECYKVWYEGGPGIPDFVDKRWVKFIPNPELTLEEFNTLECKKYAEMLNMNQARAYIVIGEISKDNAMLCSDDNISPLLLAEKLDAIAKILRFMSNNKTNVA